MYKPDRNYRMTYQTKRMLSFIADPSHRAEVKRLMIDAEINAASKAKARSGKGSNTVNVADSDID